jgi:hypothetical protein
LPRKLETRVSRGPLPEPPTTVSDTTVEDPPATADLEPSDSFQVDAMPPVAPPVKAAEPPPPKPVLPATAEAKKLVLVQPEPPKPEPPQLAEPGPTTGANADVKPRPSPPKRVLADVAAQEPKEPPHVDKSVAEQPPAPKPPAEAQPPGPPPAPSKTPSVRILVIECPKCNFPLKLPESQVVHMLGRKARCPQCQVKFLLPSEV